MVNASGAGDALMAAFLYGEVNGLEISKTIDLGLSAGIAAIRSCSAINENMSIGLLQQIIKENKEKILGVLIITHSDTVVQNIESDIFINIDSTSLLPVAVPVSIPSCPLPSGESCTMEL